MTRLPSRFFCGRSRARSARRPRGTASRWRSSVRAHAGFIGSSQSSPWNSALSKPAATHAMSRRFDAGHGGYRSQDLWREPRRRHGPAGRFLHHAGGRRHGSPHQKRTARSPPQGKSTELRVSDHPVDLLDRTKYADIDLTRLQRPYDVRYVPRGCDRLPGSQRIKGTATQPMDRSALLGQWS